jgi:superfamily II RNA helicase
MREYNSWRALCPLAAEALTPIWVYFYTQVPVPMQMICAISALRVSVPNDLRPPEARRIVLMAVQELDRRFPDGVPKLDPIEDMGIEDENLAKIVREIDAEEKKLVAHPLFQVLKMLEITFPWILITIFNSSSKNS